MMTQIEIEKTSEVESAIATLRKHIKLRSPRTGIIAWWQKYHAANPATPVNPPRMMQTALSVPWEDLCKVIQVERYRRDAEQTILNFAKWIEIETAPQPEPVHEAGCTVERPEAGNDAVTKSVRDAADRWFLLLDFLRSEPFAPYFYRGKSYRKEVAKAAKPCNYCLRMILVCDPVYLENVPSQAGESGWRVCTDCMSEGESK